jgi:hypothetical protein
MAYIAPPVQIPVNVRAFGAVGDGVHDDTAALNAAAAGGLPLWLPPGIWTLSSPLVLATQGAQLWGSDETVKWGPNLAATSCLIQPTPDFSGSSIISCTTDYTTIRGLTISSTGTTHTIPAVLATGTGNNLYRVAISNLGGVQYAGASRFVIEDVLCSYTGATGFNLIDASIGFLNRCNAGPAGNNGDTAVSYSLVNGGSINVTSCEANGTPYRQLYNYNSVDNEFYDFEANGATDAQIHIENATDVVFTRLYVLQDSTVGLRIKNSSIIQVQGGWIGGSVSSTTVVIVDSAQVTLTPVRLDGDTHGADILAVLGTSAEIAVTGVNFYGNGAAHGVRWASTQTPAYSALTGNTFSAVSGTAITASTTAALSDSTLVIAHNAGFNPVGPLTAPAMPASGTPYTNGFLVDCQVAITGGTVTSIAIGGQTTGLTSGVFHVPAGVAITVTYSAAPTWTWYGL